MNGFESRVTNDHAAERWPAISADGSTLACVSDGTRKLRVRSIDGGGDSTVLTDPRIARSASSQAENGISWTASGPRGCVYVSPLDGRYVNLVSKRHAESAWSPDGKTLVFADIGAADAIAPVGYTVILIAPAIATQFAIRCNRSIVDHRRTLSTRCAIGRAGRSATVGE